MRRKYTGKDLEEFYEDNSDKEIAEVGEEENKGRQPRKKVIK